MATDRSAPNSKKRLIDSFVSDDDTRSSCGLLDIHRDVFLYLLSFLKGKDLSALEVTCKQIKADNITEFVAKNAFKKYHPNLSQQLLSKHIKYMEMQSASYKYLYHLCLCYPTVQEINSKFRKEIKQKTNYRNSGHIHYMLEKIFGCGNIVLLTNTIKFLKQYVLTPNNQHNIELFIQHFLNYGDKIYHHYNSALDEEFRANNTSLQFKAETKLYLLKYHKDILIIGKYYDALLHLLMMECCEYGLADIAVQCRKLGAKIKPEYEGNYKLFFSDIKYTYYLDYFWMDLRDPWPAYGADNQLLQKKLDSRIAVYQNSETIDQYEKLNDFSIINNNNHFNHQMLIPFVTKLLELDAVSPSIKGSVQLWIQQNTR